MWFGRLQDMIAKNRSIEIFKNCRNNCLIFKTAFILDGIIAACDELFITLKEIQQEFHAKNGVGSKIDVFWLNNKVDSKWKEKGVRDEFRELEHAMKMRANKHGMVANVIFCRIAEF